MKKLVIYGGMLFCLSGCQGCSDMEQDIVKLNSLTRPIIVIAKHATSENHVEHLYVRDANNVYANLFGSAMLDTYNPGDTIK